MNELISKGTDTYGLPHLGAKYINGWARKRRNVKRIAEVCVVCDSARATQVHHVDPIGAGGRQSSEVILVDVNFCAEYDGQPTLLKTPMGRFTVFTPLFAVCGMGNASGCHGKLHGDYEAVWVWNDLESKELWFKGWFLSHGYEVHDERLFEYGFWRILKNDEVFKTLSRAVS